MSDTDVELKKENAFLMRYTLSGLAIGLAFPLLAWLFAIVSSDMSLSAGAISQIHDANHLLYLIDMAPLVLTAVSFFIGRRLQSRFRDMRVALYKQLDNIERVTGFAEKIGSGTLDAEFSVSDEHDTLGRSLLNMRNNLIEADRKEEERNWIITGIAEVGNVLRSGENLVMLAEQLLPYLVKRTSAIQGAFYIADDEDPKNPLLKMIGSYAYNKKKYLQAEFKFGQGLVGQAAIEKDTVFRIEIPHDYVYITSGLLGDKRPQSILIVPLIADEVVYGVLELASLEVFSPVHRRFLEELSEIVSRTIFSLKVNERTLRLLEESRRMSAELQERQEQLNQNAEEMQATQEELRHTNSKLEVQIEAVNNSQKRIQALLANSSEVIFTYDPDGKIKYVSPSVNKIMGYKPEQLTGKTELEFVHPDDRDLYTENFEKLVNDHDLVHDRDAVLTWEYSFLKSSGEYITVEAIGNNLVDEPGVEGIVINMRDITERKLAEKEARMRGQMQSLSENSPDLICRFNTEGKIFYVNPAIARLTDRQPADFLQKYINESGLNDSVAAYWSQLISRVTAENQKLNDEMNFPTVGNGELIMQVNAIPEYGENGNVESVLVVSNDITERKHIELEIKNTNKKITESINYSKRIQHAIMPDDAFVRRELPDSFMMYLPRDVVSGDFPWFTKMGDDIYYAAVDCTGHGVPGALLSLIGYFLLNDIVRSRKISNPGEILDMLDEGVNKTLRQDDENANIRDGMDIALCKINLKTMNLEFAGAHRPLYYLSAATDELAEYKGNKFAIGGGVYKNQTKFTNHQIKLSKGDSFYFCSDGYPDQFGGEDNLKFGPKRIRELITQKCANDKMENAGKLFKTAFEEWKGVHKQMDDVLMIGVRV